MVVHTDVEASLRLQCADLLLTALDHCRDVIQVTDSQDRVIYENNSTEKNLGYSSSDWFEKSIWDFQTTIGLTESVLNENETTTIKGMLLHSSQIQGLCSTKSSSETLQNLPYFIYLYENPKLLFPFFISCYFIFSPNDCPGL